MGKIIKGSTVQQILPAPIKGVVEDFVVCQETGDVSTKVVWPDVDGDGQPESRYFKLSEIELVEGE